MIPQQEISAGLDIGSVAAKLVLILPRGESRLTAEWPELRHLGSLADAEIWGEQRAVLGEPLACARYFLEALIQRIPAAVRLNLTGIHAKLIAATLELPFINEFKAIAHGAVTINPAVRTVLEIGGDASRYLHIHYDAASRHLALLDYARNGDCAAGTGSFIDQQVARMRFEVAEISGLVATAENSANIAGRCSVFAKSDMVHAQQRGYTPAAILKGLCEAVVRNYLGTVLRGKTLEAPVMFLGGVAANRGVAAALAEALELELLVPELHAFAAALGGAALASGGLLAPEHLRRIAHMQSDHGEGERRSQRLQLDQVTFVVREPSAVESGAERIPVYLGIDIGSVSTNLVLLDRDGQLLDEIYTRTEGKPVQVVQREFRGWREKWADRIEVLGVGTTGSGREMVGELVGADTINDEITAHKTGAAFIAARLQLKPVDTIFEIGGQDSKFIAIENGVVTDFAMNEACAAGTGSFLEEQAAKLGISIIDEFARLALASQRPAAMGERCTVFMEKDLSAFLQQGMAREDIAAGLAFAVVQNYLNRVVRGRKIGETIFFQGGTAYNQAVAAAFAATLGVPIIVPPHCGVMGAIGAALLARTRMEKMGQTSRFHGFDLEQVHFSVRQFICKACSNQCDMQEVTVNGEKTWWGDKCSEKYRKKSVSAQRPVAADLFALHHELLARDIPGPDGLGITIGIPRAMYYFDRFPFWRAYFGAIGAGVVLSDPTNRQIIAAGRQHCIAEPCFPILAAHGHVADLMQKGVDYLFLPNAINAESNQPETQSWYCPWGQTLPLVIKNTFYESEWAGKILAPVIRFRDGREHVACALQKMAARLGVSAERHRRALELAYVEQERFRESGKRAGCEVLARLAETGRDAVMLLGRPYNIMDPGLNLNLARKLRDFYGIDVIPMDYLEYEHLDIRDIHENMFWNYGRRILQAARYAGEAGHLHPIYITNFKCGPDSYIKHWVHQALGAPFLTLQFDEHGNDAGMLTRCEAYLQSKGLVSSGAATEIKIGEPV